ncbi:MAG: hypothetical protein R3B90_22535 [Planctomycetaceae bacterium]
MPVPVSERRIVWIALGAVLGCVLSVYWPQEPALGAYSASGGDDLQMCSCTTAIGTGDAVFILDGTSGRLIGGIYGNGGFPAMYIRNLAADFGVTDGASYIMVPASVAPRVPGRGTSAEGVLFVAEQKSGQCGMYGFTTAQGQNELVPLANFRWRGA